MSRTVRIRRLFRRRDETNHADMPLLSVYRDLGVVLREGRDDNFNRPGEDLAAYQLVRRGDLVLNKMKTWQGSLGVSALEGIVSPAYFVAERTSDDEPRYLHYALRSLPMIAEYARRSKGIRPSQWDLPWDEFADIEVSLPDPDEQRGIADSLDRETARIDRLVDAAERITEAIQARWQATMAAGVAGRLTHTKFKSSRIPWLPTIPKHWQEVKLNLVARLGSGHTPSRSHPEWWVSPSIPWITTGEVEQFRSDRVEYVFETRELISELGMANSAATLHPAGTVVLCRTASAGFSAIMGRDMATSQDFATWTCGPLILPRFLLLCLRVMRSDLLGRLAMGSTHQTIYMPDIASIEVPLPPIDDQFAVVDAVYRFLPAIDRAISTLGRQLDLFRERKQSLITAAVSGQLTGTGTRS